MLRLATVIRHKHLHVEAALVAQKWPAYRFLSPMRLNRMFREAYNDICHARQPRDTDEMRAAFGGIGAKLDFAKSSSQHTQLHIARQYADLLGMPYGEYIRFCFDFGERRQRNFIPRPNQLRPSKQAQEAWCSKLQEYWTDGRIWIQLMSEPNLESYDVRNDAGLPAQSSFRSELLRHAQQGTVNPEIFYGLVVLQRCWLLPDDLLAIDHDIWSRARVSAEGDVREGGYVPVPHAHPGPTGLQQGCYGLPGIDTTTEVTCQTCPALQSCDLLRPDILGQVRDQHNCDDPANNALRRKNRERVRTHRATKKAAGASSPKPQSERAT